MSLRKWLGIAGPAESEPSSPEDVSAIRRIAAALDAMEPERARYLAAFAFLLGRVAYADLDVSDAESHEMQRLLTEWGGLPEEQAVLAVAIAKTQNRLFGGTESFLASRALRDVATREEKQAVLHALFAVSAADDSISTVEEEEIRKISKELGLSHEEYVAIRAAYRDKREVLRGA